MEKGENLRRKRERERERDRKREGDRWTLGIERRERGEI
jgi:hypothetical protein